MAGGGQTGGGPENVHLVGQEGPAEASHRALWEACVAVNAAWAATRPGTPAQKDMARLYAALYRAMRRAATGKFGRAA